MSEENKDVKNIDDNTDDNGVNNNQNSNTDTKNNTQNKSDDSTDSDNSEGERMFTQAEVSAMMTKEKKQGKNSVLRDLGIDPKDEKSMKLIKAIVASQKEDEGEGDSNSQNELVRRAEVAEAKAEAMMSGIKKEFVEDAVTLVMAKSEENTDLKTLFSELKTKYPVWFESEDDDSESNSKNSNVGNKGTGSSIGSKSDSGNDTSKSLGARLAAQRKGQSKVKTSYWK